VSARATVREVGMRDGLQIIGPFMQTEHKIEWLTRCVEAGFAEVEIGSFVPEKYIPQFRDVEQVAAHARSLPALTSAAFIPNLRGAQRALDCGIDRLLCVLSATESFSKANLRRTKQQSLDELKAIVALRSERANGAPRAAIEVGVSVAFGCPFEGRISDTDLYELAAQAADAGVDGIALADTAGQGDPAQVKRVFRTLARELPGISLSAHFHDTRGQGLANVVAALDAGVVAFDSALAGLGGCPNSPGATGNIATEDLVCMLESMGLDTGIDIHRLLEIRTFVAQCLPDVRLYGHIGTVGLPKGFVA
jgi:hydroxymethylglutaryl-CoA lyase